MTEAHGETLVWDLNGNMVTSITAGLEYNWDNKLRSGSAGADSVHCKYAPDGSMVYMETTTSGSTTKHKYIVDTVGPFPVILMVLDADANDAALKTYIHANGQVLMQHDGDIDADRYFYLHDRLGSVRQVIDPDADVVNCYTYDPWGATIGTETNETLPNRYRFANYRWNPQLQQYYCNARWYDPTISRFTGRDPVRGKFQEPMTVHAYLYCVNDPVNKADALGLVYYIKGTGRDYGLHHTQQVINAATDFLDENPITGPFDAFNTTLGKRAIFDYKGLHWSFKIDPYTERVIDSEFGNFLAGYTTYYHYGMAGVIGAFYYGDKFSKQEYKGPDDLASRRWIVRGALAANLRKRDEGQRGISGLIDEVVHLRPFLWNVNIMTFEDEWQGKMTKYESLWMKERDMHRHKGIYHAW